MNDQAYLKSHNVFGEIIVPGAVFIESALAAAYSLKGRFPVAAQEISLQKPLRMISGSPYEYQVSVTPSDAGYIGRINVHPQQSPEWEEYVRFHLSLDAKPLHRVVDIESLKVGKKEQNLEGLYVEFARHGLQYGPEFQVLQEAWIGSRQALVRITLHKDLRPVGYCIHPTLLDGAFQAIALLVKEKGTYLPSMIDTITCYQHSVSQMWAEINLLEEDARGLKATVALYDSQGVEVAFIEGFRARATDQKSLQRLIHQGSSAAVYIEEVESCSVPEKGLPIDAPVLFSASRKQEAALRIPAEWKCLDNSDTEWTSHHIVVLYENNLQSLVSLAQRALKTPPLSFTLIVQQAFAVQETGIEPSQRAALGFWRTFAQESGGSFPCYLIDAQPLLKAVHAIPLLIQQTIKEAELIVRGKEFFVPRLYREEEALRYHQRLLIPQSSQYLVSTSGIDTLHWASRPLPMVEEHELRIRIRATALNFRDVLNAMDLYPGNAGDLGYECAGEVLEVGSKVKKFAVGDRVVVMGEGLFGEEAVIHEVQACRLPENLSMAEGASLPIVFLTTYYGLHTLAKLKRGQKILIHAATGGVGLAAIAFARLKGAEIYATASAGKQSHLRGMGIRHIYDSRTVDFGTQILEDTGGSGVDVVLNSLTSEGFIASSLSCLKKGGVFLEIAKINIYTPEEMQAARADVRYHIIGLDTRIAEEPEVVQKELARVLQWFAEGKLHPLPVKEFDVQDTIAAFHYLQQARQIGKVVVVNPQPFAYQPEASYLITGGTGGLGLELAKHLIGQGVRHVILTSRSAPGEGVQAWLEEQQQSSVDVRHYPADAADKKALAKVFKAIAQSKYPLKGIFHAAGVLRDGMLINLTPEDFASVLIPKVEGAKNLDALSRTLDLDCFVLFSSMTSLFGNAGQSNYAAANAFMDGLAQARQQEGLPALSINWGPFANVGMAAQLTGRHSAQGVYPLEPAYAFNRMDDLLTNAPAQAALLRMDWQKAVTRSVSYVSHLVQVETKEEGEWIPLLKSAPARQRGEIISAKLKHIVAQILNIQDPDKIDSNKGFFEMGMDSLMAVDLKNKIQQQLQGALQLSNTLAFDYNNIHVLRDYLLEQLQWKEKTVTAPETVSAAAEDSIAIVGVSADFPGAPTTEEFWQLLIEGREGISDIPATRWNADQYYDPDPQTPGKMVTRRGGFIQDIGQFDSAFFAISPKEATYLDPQQRLLLTQTWLALENAGIAPDTLTGTNTGVFIGISGREYSDLIAHNSDVEAINAYMGTGNSLSTASGRISYTLGLEGPNMAIDTACSASLVALNEACKWLSRGECSMAIVGGVNALLSPEVFINFSKAGMLSPDGRCKTFDESADGYVRGEGCGVVILKRLSDAITDKDRILAVIKSSGVNQDGASSGLTVPNGPAQERLLRKVLARSGLKANDIDYVECHGTGTSLGDPIEVHALGDVYGKNRDRPLYLGSVKTNVGHLESAAGMAGLIKTVLALNAEKIPPHLHFKRLNPHIQMDFPAEIVTRALPWPRGDHIRRAALSSFGFSGTNAHVIVEEAPQPAQRDTSIALPKEQVFALSAKTRVSLEKMIAAYREYLQDTKENLSDICYTAAVGRSHFGHRLAMKVTSLDELRDNLENAASLIQEVVLKDSFIEESTSHGLIAGSSEGREERDHTAHPDTLMKAYLNGETVNWTEYYAPFINTLRKVQLPSYGFETRQYWIEIKKKTQPVYGRVIHELTGARLPGYGQEIRFLNLLEASEGYLKSHVVFGEIIVPGAGLIESALAAAYSLNNTPGVVLQEVSFLKPLRLNPAGQYEYQVSLTPMDSGYQGSIHAHLFGDSQWEEYATFQINSDAAAAVHRVVTIESLQSGKSPLELDGLYEAFARQGLHYGPEFQVIKEAWVGNKTALVRLSLPETLGIADYCLHPALLDGAFQGLALLVKEQGAYLPSMLEHLTFYQTAGARAWAEIRLREADSQALKADITVYDEQGIELARMEGFRARATNKESLQKLIRQTQRIEGYREEFEPYIYEEKAPVESPVWLYAGKKSALELKAPAHWQHRQPKEEAWRNHHLVFVYEEDLLKLVKLAKRTLSVPPLSMTLIVQQAFAVKEDRTRPGQREALGFWRSFIQEVGGSFPCFLIDAVPLSEAILPLYGILQNDVLEPELIVRGTEFFVPRLYREEKALQHRHQLPFPENRQYLLSTSGIDTLHWGQRPEYSLQAHEMRLRIAATALNFRDVLNAMDLYPGNAGNLGYECAGEVLEVGSKVKKFAVGDRVVVMGEGLFGEEAVIHEVQACRLPENLSMAEGASLPIVFLTTYYGLHTLAKLKRGQKILIHAATGGVGLAAIAFARLKGAEIYATASAGKQSHLRGMGITHIYDSRTVDFGAQILEDTGGSGVDVVLNSLTSEGFIASSLSCLKKGGVFLEIAKINIYTPEEMQAARADVRYHIIGLDTRIAEEPEVVQKELARVLQWFAKGKLQPLPVKEFDVQDTIAAFHYLQQARQIGKVVVVNPQAFSYKSEASYLITGGTGGLGLELAKYLIGQGVRHVILTSRSAPGETLQAWMEEQQQSSVDVCHYPADAADKKALAKVFKAIAQSKYPLKGIFHAAGVLRDGMLINLTPEDFASVLIPKVEGAKNLDALSRTLDLDCFVLFSSMTSLFGNAGQSNYAAANAFMDGLAQARQQEGLPALSINWGPFANVGMAAQLTGRHSDQGVIPLETASAFQRMDALLTHPPAQVALMRIDWHKAVKQKAVYLSHLVQVADQKEGAWVTLLEAAPAKQRTEILSAQLKQTLAQVLNLPDSSQIDSTKGFFEMGMDSLMAVDLKNKIQQQLQGSVQLSNTLAFDYNNIRALRDHLLEKLEFKKKAVHASEISAPVTEEEIAIIGVSGDFPGAESTEEFWQLLIEGREGVCEIPATRWNAEQYYDPNPQAPGKMNTRRGGFIKDIEQFDSAFFTISPKEAKYLDPQQRLLLTQTWLALEDAGIAPKSLAGSDTGVFIGIASQEYSDLIGHYSEIETINAYMGTGNALSTASGRISYTLGLEGPNLAIDTACSSSLSALHEACKWLSRGECKMAIVGGVNALLTPELFINFSKAGMLASDGRCKTFDESADGYVRGEGCGVVVVKRLSDALADNDRILAVIKSSGINQDGASSGLTVPNGPAQERLLRKVLSRAGLKANDIDYVECHGTGTSLGDPIEVHALGEVYGQERTHPLYLGSVKTNIGHLEAAAGIAGLIKVVLALNAEKLPPHLNFTRLNPHIQMDFPAEIVTRALPWARGERVRRAAVSSFGFSGTNTHVIVEEAPNLPERNSAIALPKEHIFVLSAKTRQSLEKMIAAYREYLEDSKESLADICYTAAAGRSHFAHRLGMKVSTLKALRDNLKDAASLIKEVVLKDSPIEEPTSRGLTAGTSDGEKNPNADELLSPEKVLQAYLNGEAVDWAEYYAPYIKALRKVRLPSYCFDKKRYWIETVKGEAAIDWSVLSQWCFGQVWEPVSVPLVSVEPSVDALSPALVLAPDADVAKVWEALGEVRVLSRLDKEAIGEVLAEGVYERVIVLCREEEDVSVAGQSLVWLRGLVALSQVLAEQEKVPALLVVTEKAQSPGLSSSQDSLSLSLAPLSGFIKSLQIEVPALRCRLLDVEDLSDATALQAMVTQLPALPVEENLLAVRHGLYYAPRVVRQVMEATGEFAANGEGSYLITGGLGALGQALSQWLIERGARSLALLGRSRPSEAVGEQIAQWREEGIAVEICQGDVSDLAQVKKVLKTLRKANPVCGIFHLAGVGESAYLQDIELEDVERVLQAKVAGAYNLHQASKDLPLECFVLFSSISAFIGSQKQSLYAAANHFLDQLSLYRGAQGLAASCIDWGPWASIGMMGDTMSEAQMSGMGMSVSDLIAPHQALALLSRVLTKAQQGEPLAVVSPNYLRFMLGFMPSPLPAWVKRIKSQLPQPKAASTVNTEELRNHLLAMDEGERKEALQSMVGTVVGKVLGLESAQELPVGQGFFDMGMDSLMAVEIQSRLQQEMGSGLTLGANLAFDYPSIASIRDYLYEELFGEGRVLSLTQAGGYTSEAIAIVGMGCHFPGNANSPQALWEMLASGKDGIVEVPKTRWDVDAYYDANPDAPGKSYTRYGGFVSNIEQFDAAFFNISPREAQLMDPQQRMMLQVSYKALESAGYSLEQIKGSAGGVFVGVSVSEYSNLLNDSGKIEDLNIYYATGNALNVISGRLSYTYGLEGPSEIVDTACSSSLVALHHGIQSLRNKECDFAIVGGVNAMVSPGAFVALSKAKMLSPEGHCKTFDEKADGYARGEGCGVVILKRLSDARKDRDTILAVIKGSGVNQDGFSSGLTVPRGPAQQAVIAKALYNAGVAPENVDYVECHGTGTSLGDPIEVEALAKTYGTAHQDTPLVLGTVKTNIGHLESAAGIAGLIKVIVSLQHEAIPPHLHFHQLNPHIDLAAAHAELPLSLMPWKAHGHLRCAAVSSFGFSGTNAHVIVEEAPNLPERDTSIALPSEQVFVLSAKSRQSLEKMIAAYREYLEDSKESLADICYTAAAGRSHFAHRLGMKVSTLKALRDNLKDAASLIKEVVLKDSPIEEPTSRGLTAGTSDGEKNPNADELLSPEKVLQSYLNGEAVNWTEYYAPFAKALRKVRLPSYCFEPQRYWIAEKAALEIKGARFAHVLLQHDAVNFKEKTYLFTTELNAHTPDFLKDHLIYDEIVVAGAVYLSAMMAFAFQVLQVERASLHGVEFIQPLVLGAGTRRSLQISVKEENEEYVFEIYSLKTDASDEVVVHATGRLRTQADLPVEYIALEKVRERLTQHYSGAGHQANIERFCLRLGGHFHWLKDVYYNGRELLAELRAPQEDESVGYEWYPGMIDSSFQSALVWVGEDALLSIPLAIERIDFSRERPQWVYIRHDEGIQSIQYLDANGMKVAQCNNFSSRAVSAAMLKKILKNQTREASCLYHESYEPYALPKVSATKEEALLLLYLSAKNYKAEEWQGAGLTVQPVLAGEAIEVSARHVVFVYENDVQALRAVMQAMLQTPPLSFTLITRQGCAVIESEAVNPLQSAALGLWKTFVLESSVPSYAIDAPEYGQAKEALRAIVRNALKEPRLAIRGTQVWVARLLRLEDYQKERHWLAAPKEGEYLVSRSGIETLEWEERALGALAPTQVRLRVEAVALNFRDVLKAMDLYPGDAGDFGYECAGVVREVGSKVKDIAPGTAVIGMGKGLLAGEAILDAVQVCALPPVLSMAEGAAIPIVFLTTNYALNQVAGLTRGQKILIHAAAGGVGLAAIAFAKRAGAEIYATASRDKQQYLREELGIRHIYDSRSTDFGTQILADTGGTGVDIVLNSLTSEGFIEASLSCLRDGGLFLEVGKLNIYTQEQMQRARADVRYHIIEQDRRMAEEPAVVQRELSAILELFAEQILQPLPLKAFSVRDSVAAFHYLQKARNIGKVVLSIPPPFQYRQEASYFISGGSGGLGLELARHLIAQGARHIVFGSRSPASASLQEWIAEQEALGIEICHYQADVTDKKALAKVFTAIAQSGHPLKGIFHTAGVLRDAMLMNLTAEDFSAVLAPKVQGAQNLDALSRGLDLDCFVLFSSVSALLGSPGQANYATANAFMDGLAQARRQQGLPALSINWGPFANVGMAAQLTGQHSAQGMLPLQTSFAFSRMDTLLSDSIAQVGFMQVNWSVFTSRASSYLSYLVNPVAKEEREWIRLLQATPVLQREQVLSGKIKQLVAQILHIHDPAQIDVRKDFFEYGMDSLMVVSMTQTLQETLGEAVTLNASVIFNYKTIRELTRFVLDSIPFKEEEEAEEKNIPAPAQESLVDISAIERLVANKQASKDDLMGALKNVRDLVDFMLNTFQAKDEEEKVISKMEDSIPSATEEESHVSEPSILSKESTEKNEKSLSVLKFSRHSHKNGVFASHGQTRLFWATRMSEDKSIYNIGTAVKVHQKISAEQFKKSCQYLIEKYPLFQIGFSESDKGILQTIYPHNAHNISLIEIETVDTLNPLIHEILYAPFDLETGPLYRFAHILIKSTAENVLVYAWHHTIMDGVSVNTFITNLANCLADLAENRAINEKKQIQEAISFFDYALTLHDFYDPMLKKQQVEYWKKQLEGKAMLTELPGILANPSGKQGEIVRITNTLEKNTVERLNRIARENGTTLFSVLLSAFYVLLYKHLQREDLTIGILSNGRYYPNLFSTIGYLVNTLPVTQTIHPEQWYPDYLRQCSADLLACYENQYIDLHEIINALKLPRIKNKKPLFQILFNHSESEKQFARNNSFVEPILVENGSTDYDLCVSFYNASDATVNLEMSFNASSYEREYLEEINAQYALLLQDIAERPRQKIDDFTVISPRDYQKILLDWNQTQVDYPAQKTIQTLFMERAQQNPDANAVLYENRRLSYRELDEKSNQLAHYLQTKYPIGPESIVGVFQERTEKLIITLLGILKAGGVYLPLDIALPGARIAFMLGDSQPLVVLSQSSLHAHLQENLSLHEADFLDAHKKTHSDSPDPKLPVIESIEQVFDTEEFQQQSLAAPEYSSSPENMAYIIYTSGSTGVPKGVMIEQRSSVNMALDYAHRFDLHSGVFACQYSNIAFDASIWEMFSAFVSGAGLCIIPEEAKLDNALLLKFFNDNSIQHTFLPTAVYRHLDMRYAKSLKTLVVGGEKLESFTEVNGLKTYNAYGPSECTVCATMLPMDKNTKIPPSIGRPLNNTQIYIVDKSLRAVPVGAAGELLIGGDGVARGYLNRPDLTAEKFVSNPFKGTPGKRLYRTGDLCRYLSDGTIEFIGRIDFQVKVRGFRIEMGEIESILTQLPWVQEAILVAKEDEKSGTKQLIAYITLNQKLFSDRAWLQRVAESTDFSCLARDVWKNKAHFTARIQEADGETENAANAWQELRSAFLEEEELRAHIIQLLRKELKERLPDYMIPAYFILLDKIPLNSNGKIDRHALPDVQMSVRQVSGYVAPRTEVEKTLVNVWQDVLKIEKVGVFDNFFEIGGDSIISIQIISRLRNEGLRIAPKDIFSYQNIAELALVTREDEEDKSEQGDLSGTFNLIPIQHHFFAAHLANPNHFNQSMLLEIAAPLDLVALERALETLMHQHDALRLRFIYKTENNTYTQQYLEEDTLPLEVREVPEISDAKVTELCTRAQARLDIHHGPLWRVLAMRQAKCWKIFFVIHHLAVDGVSWRILLNDFTSYYQQAVQEGEVKDTRKTHSYRQWSDALMRFASQIESDNSLIAYWQSQLPPTPENVAFPLSMKQESSIKNISGSQSVKVNASLSKEKTRLLLNEVSIAYKTEMNDILLTALWLTYQQHTGHEKLYLHLEGHGREQDILPESIDISRTLGWFTSLFPLCLDGGSAIAKQTGTLNLKTLICALKEQIHRIPHKGLDYGVLRYLASDSVKSALEEHIVPEISFNYLGRWDEKIDNTSFCVSSQDTGSYTDTKNKGLTALDINCLIVEESFNLSLAFDATVYKEDSINIFVNDYIHNLENIIQHCLEETSGTYTPSDFPLANLKQSELDNLQAFLLKKGKNL